MNCHFDVFRVGTPKIPIFYEKKLLSCLITLITLIPAVLSADPVEAIYEQRFNECRHRPVDGWCGIGT
jgi:hypothetical protein